MNEYADLLQKIKAARAEVSAAMLRSRRGFGRWILSVSRRLLARAERECRAALQRGEE